MCTYLYAAFSLRDGAPDLSAEEQAAVAGWRRTIVSIAVEEMGHLLLVANLAIAIGGRPHFGRPNFPIAPGHFPAEVVVRLAPFSPETLDHFIFLERPKGSELPDAAAFEPATDYRREEAYHGITPSIQDYATIGGLYEAIRANLIALTRRLGQDALFIGPVTAQAGEEVIDLGGVTTIDSLESAVAAIDRIVEEGEGSSADRETSHFRRFLSIRDDYRALASRNPNFAPAWPAAENPVMRRPPEPESLTFIDDPAAARVMDFGNATYALILQLIVQTFGRADGTGPQKRLMSAAIDLMHVLGAAGRALVTIPGCVGREDVHAGLSFALLRGVEPLFEGEVERRLLDERLSELIGAARVAARVSPMLEGLDKSLERVRAYIG